MHSIPFSLRDELVLKYDLYNLDLHHTTTSQATTDSVVTGVWAGRSSVHFQAGPKIFFSKTSRPALRPIQPLIQWILGVVSPRVKQTGA
jgi:hypothetical protein